MAYVITQNCCNDASCVVVCPVGCIHPRPDEPDFGTAEMLYIDAKTCIDCGACADACPVDAILPGNIRTEETEFYRAASDDFFGHHPQQPDWDRRLPLPVRGDAGGLRVAIVGSGAAGWYAAKDLLRHPGVEVHMFDRVPVPGGLIRHGVAPDHPDTKSVMRQFRWGREQEQRFSMHLGVEIGANLTHDDLTRHHHAVVYAHGATTERLLGVPGEQLPGVVGALGFVGWYNGHPDNADLAPELSGERVVVIGNGNVALDVARVITGDPNMLAHTDIADHALTALRSGAVREVVVLGRGGPAAASFTTPELHGLSQVPGLDVIVDPADLDGAPETPKTELLRLIAEREPTPGNKRIVLRFNVTADEILGEDRVTGVRVRCGDRVEEIDACLVVRAVGFLGAPMPGVPFDAERAIIPTVDARVVDADTPLAGVYATGWARRGPRGGIGSNRTCAEETVLAVLDDYAAGRLPTPTGGDIGYLLRGKRDRVVDKAGRAAIDESERAAGARSGRPRRKLTDAQEMLGAASSGRRRLPLWPLRHQMVPAKH